MPQHTGTRSVATPHRRIAALPPQVVERIAAGEVIERPASVVRELIENALDAGATSIRVELRDGGLRLIRVADDGAGIPADDLELACRSHTTSKVRDLADLGHIATLGFRGEALASIAAVAELELASAAEESGLAHTLLLVPGERPQTGATPRSRGTTVTVRHLFADVPARHSLLRGPTGEANRVAAVVRGYALAHPAVHVTLTSDGEPVLQTHGDTVEDAVRAIYGGDVARALTPIGPVDVAGGTIRGVAARRPFDAPSRQHVLLIINGRPVSNRALLSAIESGYRPLLRKGRHPVLIATLSAPPDAVDVNVHPAKQDVLLRHEQAVCAALRAAVYDALGSVTPNAGLHVAQDAGGGLFPAVQLRLPTPRKRRGLLLGERRAAYRPPIAVNDEPAPAELPELEPLGQFDDALILARSPVGDLYLVDQHRAHERILYESLLRQTPHSLRPPEVASSEEGDAGAAEPGQLLLTPVLVELTQAQAALLAPRLEELGRLGLDCQHFGGTVFLVRSLPPLPDAAAGDGGDLARALVRDAAEDADDWLDHVRISLACRSAIRRGDPLTPQQQRTLLARLRAVQVAGVCPHGSPLALRYSRGFLARTFDW